MHSQNKETLKKIAEISEEIFSNSPVLFAYIYGSVAAGQTHPFSDLDIGVFVESISSKEGLELELDLGLKIDRKLQGGPSSDVRIMNFLPILITGKIVSEGLLIYCRNDKKRIAYETAIRTSYFDFLPFIRQYQKAYLKQVYA